MKAKHILYTCRNKFKKMECLSHKSEIQDTFSSVRDFSFTEKKSPLLDKILDKKNKSVFRCNS